MPPIDPPVSAQELQILSTKAIAAKGVAHCPYSNFRVGACLLTASGEYVVGANVENVSYPIVSLEAQSLFVLAIAEYTAPGCGHKDFKAIAVASDIKPGASPCGMCRQFIREFTTPSFPVYMYDADGAYTMKTMGELLPDSFGPKDLLG
ncbi:Cytidine deaminase [Penicillium chermesinum]|nr:Cytidine deaminase [Penicillium chermesinum]